MAGSFSQRAQCTHTPTMRRAVRTFGISFSIFLICAADICGVSFKLLTRSHSTPIMNLQCPGVNQLQT